MTPSDPHPALHSGAGHALEKRTGRRKRSCSGAVSGVTATSSSRAFGEPRPPSPPYGGVPAKVHLLVVVVCVVCVERKTSGECIFTMYKISRRRNINHNKEKVNSVGVTASITTGSKKATNGRKHIHDGYAQPLHTYIRGCDSVHGQQQLITAVSMIRVS